MARSDIDDNVEVLLLEHHRDTIDELFSSFEQSDPLMAALEGKAEQDGFGKNGYLLRFETTEGSAVGEYDTADSQSSSVRPGGASMTVTPTTIDAFAQWNRQELLAVQGKSDETFDILDRERKKATIRLRKRLAIYLNGDGTGKVGVVGGTGTVTGNVIPVVGGKWMANRFKKGDQLQFAATATGALRAGGHYQVTNVNPTTGDVTTLDGSAGGTAASNSVAANDLIFFRGVKSGTGSEVEAPMGWMGWLPQNGAAATGDSHFGLDRYAAGGHTDGLRYDASADSDIASALINAASDMFIHDRVPRIYYVCAREYAALAADKDLAKSVQISVGKYTIGFGAIELHGPTGGPIKVMAAPFVEPGHALGGTFDGEVAPMWLYGGDGIIHIDNHGRGTSGATYRDGKVLKMNMMFLGQCVFPNPSHFQHVSTLPT